MKTLTNVLYSLLYKDSKGFFIENPLKVCGGIGCFSFHAFSFCCGVPIHSSLNCCGAEKIWIWWGRNNFFHIFRSFQIWTELHMLIRWRNFVLLIEVSATQTFPLRRLVLQTGISGKYKLPFVFSFFIYLFIVSVFLLLSWLYLFLLSIKMFSDSDQHKMLWHFSLFFHYLFYYCYVFFKKNSFINLF